MTVPGSVEFPTDRFGQVTQAQSSLINRILLSCAVAFAAMVPVAGGMSAQEAQFVSYATAGRGGVSEHVILISIDGLRPEAIRAYDAPTLQRLLREGSYSLSAMTVVPSKTLPSHTSMLTGVSPEVHGITWNSHHPELLEYVELPTVFGLAREAGLSTAAFAAKAKFRHLFNPGELDYFEAPSGNATHWMASQIAERAVNYLRHERPNLLFVHFGEPDFAGHTLGWMGAGYGWAVRRSDAGVARIIETADEVYGAGRYTLLVTSDHGGHARSHGTADPLDRTIPWIAYGEGVRAGHELLPGIRTMDTAATVLWVLGVPVPDAWAGRPVMSAFTARSPLPVTTAAGAL